MDRHFDLGPGLSPGAARRVLARILAGITTAETVGTAQLLASEVVTNAIRHGRGWYAVDAVITDDSMLTVNVTDSNPRMPVIRAGDPDADSGRGMRIVDSLARSWTATPRDDGGKVVSFTLWL